MPAADLFSWTYKVRPYIKSGSTELYGAYKKTVSNSAMKGFSMIAETNPATGLAWTVSEVQALQFGVQVGAED